NIRIPHRLGGGRIGLDPHISKARYCRPFRAINLEGHQIISADAGSPGGVELRDDPIVQFKDGIGRIIGGGLVGRSVFFKSFINMGSSEARDPLYLSKKIIEYIAPVAKHIQNNTSAVLFAIVPRRTLCRNGVSFKYPVSKVRFHR